MTLHDVVLGLTRLDRFQTGVHLCKAISGTARGRAPHRRSWGPEGTWLRRCCLLRPTERALWEAQDQVSHQQLRRQWRQRRQWWSRLLGFSWALVFPSLSEPQEHGVVGQPGMPQLTVPGAALGARLLEPTALRGLAAERAANPLPAVHCLGPVVFFVSLSKGIPILLIFSKNIIFCFVSLLVLCLQFYQFSSFFPSFYLSLFCVSFSRFLR